jgi:CRISPR-associated endonuclease Cas2
MGKLERKSTKLLRRTKLQEAVLATVTTAGVISISLLAPQVVKALYKLGVVSHVRKNDVVRSTASRLKEKGLLKFENGYYSLTQAGEKILRYWQMADYQIQIPKKWDKKWRVIIFDIPEKKRRIRAEVRRILMEAGFQRLQDSVWVHPYDCEDVIGLVKTNLRIGKDMLYLIVDQVENDRHLRLAFGLS